VRDPRPPSDPAEREKYEVERRRVDDFVKEIVVPGSALHGVGPAPFAELGAFRDHLAGHLKSVIAQLTRWYRRRNILSVIAGVVVVAAAVVASSLSGKWQEAARAGRELTTERVAHATEVIELAMGAARNDPNAWDSVRGIDRLGCAAVEPLSTALVVAESRADLVGGPAAIVDAMAGLARKPGLACGCRALLGMLAVVNPAHHCKSTHQLVLDALGTLSCRDDSGVVNAYIDEMGKNDPAATLKNIMCESEVIDSDDLRDLERRACLLPHGEPGRCARPQGPR